MRCGDFLKHVLALCVTTFACSAGALTLGVDGQIFYSGGDLVVENQPASSGYSNSMYLSTTGGERFLFVDDGDQVVTFTQSVLAGYGIGIGDELLFLVRPDDGATAFYTGPKSRNVDAFHHAKVSDLGDGTYLVGFEDMLNGGDQDFNDALFRVVGGGVPDPDVGTVSEPYSVSLIGIALLGLAGIRRRRGA